MNQRYSWSLKLTIFLLVLKLPGLAQEIKIDRVEPLNWWVDMKYSQIQVLIHGQKIKDCEIQIQYPGVTVKQIRTVDNPNYLFIDLGISAEAKPGTMKIQLSNVVKSKSGEVQTNKKISKIIDYELKPRSDFAKAQGVDQSDFIYLVLPDRFSNGDPKNDAFNDMADTRVDRKNPFLRHGGDLQGIINHLDYFKDLGVTALWLNPVLENNQPLTDEGGSMRSAYHGYGFTDHYHVDKRLGGNEAYKKLIEAAHASGLKIIQDAVYNHVGLNHWLVQDLPATNWLHQWPAYTNTSYKDQPLPDPYASKIDRKVTSDGWFVPFLPDLDQSNPLVATYLLQHALWTVENFGIDAWRIDTYMYNDLDFMNKVNSALLEEYPSIHIFGENWVNSVANQAYFQRNTIEVPFKSNLPGACDFQLQFAINDALNQAPGWNEGVQRLYQILGQDYLYEDPTKNVVFLDNHDMDRYLSVVGEDIKKYRMGLIWLLTTRGIPQLYYGTEILMKNYKNPSDAEVRRDFPGGFPGDKENKFSPEGRTEAENQAYAFVKNLAEYRKKTPALHSGKLMQYLPMDGVYVYFRYNDQKAIMVVMNSNDRTVELETGRFAERIRGAKQATDVLSGSVVQLKNSLSLSARTAYVYEMDTP